MGTSFLLLLVLITSILVTKYVSNKIDPPYVAPTEEQQQELARKAKAAAAATQVLRRFRRGTSGPRPTKSPQLVS